MTMVDGGFRPAFNPQRAAGTGRQTMVGVDATTAKRWDSRCSTRGDAV
jgi:hypothetical protein